ncbi:GTPase Era-like protein [Leptotrombidium deliense]|uniref:GTPase Era, mitochondrial n=1 Tax=Leptotrombidium deliense TaxID=299467 RepID=A0A443SMQ8_9ACAR|nr:GTPase Era-like protein [Leptotrombidium deliense]
MLTFLRRIHLRNCLKRRLYSTETSVDEFTCENVTGSRIPRTKQQFNYMKKLEKQQPENAKLNRVAIIGMPNSGKSTITNQLIGVKVSAVSSKVHTTRKNVVGIVVEKDTQIEILDTPGLVTTEHCSRFHLEPSFMNDPHRSAENADLIAVVCDGSNPREREKLNSGILRILYKFRDRPSILVINKVDLLKSKRRLLHFTDVLTEDGFVDGSQSKSEYNRRVNFDKSRLEKLFQKTEEHLKGELEPKKDILMPTRDQKGWAYFSRVFFLSALTGDGMAELKQFLLNTAKPSPWKYKSALITEQSPKILATNIIREKLLDFCVHEVPYKVNIKIINWELDDLGTLWILVDLLCEKQRHMSLVLGPNGSIISQISRNCQQELSNIFECDVSLKIIVKCLQK